MNLKNENNSGANDTPGHVIGGEGVPIAANGSEVGIGRDRDRLTRLLIKIRRGEAGYNLIKKFFRHDDG